MLTIIHSLQYGDEGKGKASHYFAQDHDIGVRYNGGPNAGHTIYADDNKKFVTHHLPATVFYNKPSVLAAGTLINVDSLKEEIANIPSFDSSNLLIDPACPIITKEHIAKDCLKNSDLGTTKQGIGPCLEDQIARRGIRAKDIPGLCKEDFSASSYLRNALNNNKSILFESAQGHFLDLWHGTYPYVTSSLCTAAAACANAGVPMKAVTNIIGVFKAYITRVGTGPLHTEVADSYLSKTIIERGKEYGSTTGRKRRVGFLDLIDLREAFEINGIDSLFITKSDILCGLDKVPILIDKKKDGSCQSYKEIPGWNTLEDSNFNKFISFIENYLNTPISWISTGPKTNEVKVRYATIKLDE